MTEHSSTEPERLETGQTDQMQQRLAALLQANRFAKVAWVPETGSTNADLLVLAADSAQPEQVLIADHQVTGRGRRNRKWENSPGSALMVSVLVRPEGPIAEAYRYTTAMGLAAREACVAEVGVHPKIKWPNDLVFGNAKLAGMLSESCLLGGDFVGLVIGIGINVRVDSGWSSEVVQRATSLTTEAVDTPEIDRVAMAAKLIERFAYWCDATPAELRHENLAQSATVGSRVSIERAGESEPLVGEAVDIDESGHLIVEAGGTRHALTVGDVTHLRRG